MAKEDSLTYLHVTFERGISGDVNRHEVTFADQVKTVYGPVLRWQDKLDPEKPGPQGIIMSCDQLTVREMPSTLRNDRGTMEMEALGNTLVEGQAFTARAPRLTYAEAKDLLVFEGNGQTDAELFRQLAPGLPATKASARKIMYWQGSNRAEVDDARHLDLGMPGGGPSKPPSKGAAGFMAPIPGSPR